jgi:hypothetical protein
MARRNDHVRIAMQIVSQLPDQQEDAREIVLAMRDLVERFWGPDGFTPRGGNDTSYSSD